MDKQNDTLYFDGACPLCNAEMKRLSRLKNDSLVLVDIHQAALPDNLEKHNLLRNLHLVKANGEIISGLTANIEAWQYTRWGFLWRWMHWPVIRLIAEHVYSTWADLRYRNRYQQ
ncbi:MAG: DCC1-like thiol-disulfide oxidoreductase family protein [Pseudomonadales bacterium]|jgi:predicted DCC family thiol-disulfide oxidoreductase YuxK|nr:DCC1-like thiol-disulfide oxidoreductase family protein [Pseudomonadales bacterium]